jgi:pyruvate/2-oxoglutarate dehydrogenase complex dihydrolipoamide dehydrogenase (E3) component
VAFGDTPWTETLGLTNAGNCVTVVNVTAVDDPAVTWAALQVYAVVGDCNT